MIRLFAKKIKKVDLGSLDSIFTTNFENTPGVITYGTDWNGNDSIQWEENVQGYATVINDNILQVGGNYTITFKVSYHYTTLNNKIKMIVLDSLGNIVENEQYCTTTGTYSYTYNNIQGNKIQFFGYYSRVSLYDIEISGGGPTSQLGEPFTELDVDTNENIVFNKSLKDIRKPEKITGEFTESFMIPVNENNSKFFGYLNNNDSLSDFDIKNKIEAHISVDGINLLDGYIQLLKIHTTNTGAKYFNIIFYGTDISIFKDFN